MYDCQALHFPLKLFLHSPLAAESIAAKVGASPEQVFKTLAVRGRSPGRLFSRYPG
ncbi:MAG: hypothetical protein QNJ46_19410 [Leptolyngbyaceae cyanobacterium MO_188.B28]|nr:hypothetical protein [Leptolyngbyaceae cyanobacterium MO_188.B28]